MVPALLTHGAPIFHDGLAREVSIIPPLYAVGVELLKFVGLSAHSVSSAPPGFARAVRTSLAVGILLLLYGCGWSRTVDHARCGKVGPQLVTPTKAPKPTEINVLLLSAGGPWGGFGAGFLQGWSQLETPVERQRPPFHVAVGVSTGATMVTHAFLGSEYIAVLRDRVLGLSTGDIYEPRAVLAALFNNSVTDTAPLRQGLKASITTKEIDAVADAWIQEGRRLAVVAVDLDCGDPVMLDLTAVALQRDDPQRVDRYIDFIMASAASPVAFPPVFIDGHMMVDGALRQHIPYPRQIAKLLPVSDGGPEPKVNVFAIINSPMVTYPQCVTDHVILIALRTSDVWTGERSADSVALTILDARRRGWSARFVAPINAPCTPIPPPEDYFNPSFIRCQYEYGYRVATAEEEPWRSSIDELPKPDSFDIAHPCEQ